MEQLAGHTGTWVGDNGFRLMAGDPLHHAPTRARVSAAAKGALTEIAYSWSHPQDGEQDGLLVLGAGEEAGTVCAFWGDSWHQKPEPKLLTGTVAHGVVTVSVPYFGDWRWDVVVDASTPDALLVEMRNVIPASAASDTKAAGPYTVMTAALRPDTTRPGDRS